MIGKISAVLASAGCAFLLVTAIPGLAPSVAAHAAPTPAVEQAGTQNPLKAAAPGGPACREIWPYYEPACLHDARQPGGRARVVRVVSIERTTPQGTLQGTALQESASRPR